MSASQLSHWWTITTHPAGSPLNLDVEKQLKKILHFLARPIIWLGAQKFIEKTINHTWAPSATSKRPQINTWKVNPIIPISITIPVTTIHTVRIHQYCLPQDSGYHRKKLHVPNRKVSSYIQKWKQVYPGCLSLWIQHHPCRTSENKIMPGFNDSLPETPELIDQYRVETAPTYSGQWMSQCAQNFHEGGKWEL